MSTTPNTEATITTTSVVTTTTTTTAQHDSQPSDHTQNEGHHHHHHHAHRHLSDILHIPQFLHTKSFDDPKDHDVAARKDVEVKPIASAYDPHSAQAHRARLNSHNNNIPSEQIHVINTNNQMSGEHVADMMPRQLRHEVIKHEQMDVYAVGVRTDTTAQSVADCWKFAAATGGCNNAALL